MSAITHTSFKQRKPKSEMNQSPSAEWTAQMQERRAARRRDGVLGEAAARAAIRRIDNTAGGMAAFVAGLSIIPHGGDVADAIEDSETLQTPRMSSSSTK